jgi:hypothetical protein
VHGRPMRDAREALVTGAPLFRRGAIEHTMLASCKPLGSSRRSPSPSSSPPSRARRSKGRPRQLLSPRARAIRVTPSRAPTTALLIPIAATTYARRARTSSATTCHACTRRRASTVSARRNANVAAPRATTARSHTSASVDRASRQARVVDASTTAIVPATVATSRQARAARAVRRAPTARRRMRARAVDASRPEPKARATATTTADRTAATL